MLDTVIFVAVNGITSSDQMIANIFGGGNIEVNGGGGGATRPQLHLIADSWFVDSGDHIFSATSVIKVFDRGTPDVAMDSVQLVPKTLVSNEHGGGDGRKASTSSGKDGSKR